MLRKIQFSETLLCKIQELLFLPYLHLDAIFGNICLNYLMNAEDRFYFEVDADCGDEGGGEGVVGVPEEEGGLAH